MAIKECAQQLFELPTLADGHSCEQAFFVGDVVSQRRIDETVAAIGATSCCTNGSVQVMPIFRASYTGQ